MRRTRALRLTWLGRWIFLSLLPLSMQAQGVLAQRENAYYQIQPVPVPEDIVLEIGGLAFKDPNTLAVCTRRGEVWEISQPSSSRPVFSRFAHGLHEPLGLAYRDGAYYLNQRGELTRLTDTDQDGKADLYEPLYVWPLAGNYHEYSYGPKFSPEGDMVVTLNLGWIGRGASLSPWRGWLLKITPQGELMPVATGMRSPAGFGYNAAGDLFYTENQGDWVGSGRMTHIEKGDFVGHPEGLKWSSLPGSPLTLKMEDIQDTMGYSLYEYEKVQPAVKPPSVWFPHTLMGISTSDILLIQNEDQVGPFAGQLLVGDQGHSKIMRVFQEKVNGVYQGICFPFREGFASGILRMIWGPDDAIYVGQTSRGWSATGKAPFALERLVWNGKVPFEMQRVTAQPDGFEITFTQPVDAETAVNPASYSITDFSYNYHHIYGSPPVDQEKRQITQVEVSPDRRKARLFLDNMRLGYVYEIRAPGVKKPNGEQMLHYVGYYTLNQLPQGDQMAMDEATGEQVPQETVNLNTPKRTAAMPGNWNGQVDESFTVGTVPGLKYDVETLTVKAGSKVKLTFNNNDDMLHNLLIVQPGKADAVGEMAMQLGLQGQSMGYVPDNEAVLFHTNLLQPNSSDVIYFEAPATPGRYMYVCTFPGHYLTMRGVLVVE